SRWPPRPFSARAELTLRRAGVENQISDKGRPFRLVNYRWQGEGNGTVRVGLVLVERILPLDDVAAYPAAVTLFSAATASELTPGLQGFLLNWEQSFSLLCELVAAVQRDGVEWDSNSWVDVRNVHVLAPILRPT